MSEIVNTTKILKTTLDNYTKYVLGVVEKFKRSVSDKKGNVFPGRAEEVAGLDDLLDLLQKISKDPKTYFNDKGIIYTYVNSNNSVVSSKDAGAISIYNKLFGFNNDVAKELCQLIADDQNIYPADVSVDFHKIDKFAKDNYSKDILSDSWEYKDIKHINKKYALLSAKGVMNKLAIRFKPEQKLLVESEKDR